MPAPSISVAITGLGSFAAKLALAPALAAQAGDVALYRIANEIFAESQRQVPRDTGNLAGSGHVELPVHTMAGTEVTIGYGGAAVDYAYIVHERMDTTHTPPTKAKYLEDPVNAARERFASEYGITIGAAVEKEMRV